VNTWWKLDDLVDWFRKTDPNASTIRILSAVEERCACGRIRARGRRRIYVWDRLPKIRHTDPEFVPMSEEYSQASPTLEEIPQTEWRDLVFFGRPVFKAGEEYLAAFVRAFDDLASPLELRSKSKYRLAWLDVEIFGDDVVREFSPAEGQAQRDAGKPELQSGVSARLGGVTAGLGSSIRRLAPVSDRDFHLWYQNRVSEFMARDETSSGEHDWIAAKQAFGGRVTRARVREMREKMVPDHWGKQGRRPASRGE
jgi:hypothetical protein